MPAIVTADELRLLEKLENGDVISEKEQKVAHRLASLGIVRLGFDDSGKNFCETGHLSQLGCHLLHLERLERRPVRRFIYTVLKPLFG